MIEKQAHGCLKKQALMERLVTTKNFNEQIMQIFPSDNNIFGKA